MIQGYAGAVTIAVISLLQFCCAQSPTRTQVFLSKPEQTALALDVKINTNPTALAEGYIFIAPYKDVFAQPIPEGQWGPHIFDVEGNLIWAGNYTVEYRAWQLQVCDYNGQEGQHLCYAEGYFTEGGGHTNGYVKVMDNTYKEIRRYEATGSLKQPQGKDVGPDGHELNTPPGDKGRSLLVDLYQIVGRELVAYGGPQNGYVLNGCFHDIDMNDGKVMFEWCSLDHIPIEETFIYLQDTVEWTQFSGRGFMMKAWDYLHINAVDRDAFGDYYISGKNTHAVYKIAGPKSALAEPGEIIWRLGGVDSSFEFHKNLNFSFQHHARVINVTHETTIISLFDNAWPGGNMGSRSSDASSGKYIEVNNKTMTARLVEQYIQPDGKLSPVEGAVQRLPNGNVFVGWGPNQFVSEHLPGLPGKTIYYAKYGDGMPLESYRNFKSPWKGYPSDPPDIFAYAENCTSDIAVYMSWNGATEYIGWKVYLLAKLNDWGTQVKGSVYGNTTDDHMWRRTGFETIAGVPAQETFMRYVYADAIDADGRPMKKTMNMEIFIPKPDVKQKHHCGHLRCRDPDFKYLFGDSMTAECAAAAGLGN